MQEYAFGAIPRRSGLRCWMFDVRCWMFTEHVEHRLMQGAVAGDVTSAVGALWILLARVIGDHSSRLPHDEHARHRVPGFEVLFPVSVEPAGADVAQVERG